MANENQIETLNDLVLINNDRVEGYRKAIENLKDNNAELTTLFSSLKEESFKNNQELKSEIFNLRGTPETGTTVSGKIYRAWMDVKASFGGDDALGVLNSCEGGEDAAKAAYRSAVESGNLEHDSAELVRRQQLVQLQGHDKIKALRDRYKS